MPGVRLNSAPGHTPDYDVVSVAFGNDRLKCIGDLVVSDSKVIENLVWPSVYDFDSNQGQRTRKRIFGLAAKDRILLMGYHAPFPGLGYVSPLGQGELWEIREAAG